MGIIHKLKPEIIDFILKQKKININISCRELSSLINDKFQKEVSKSSINTIIKNIGLSMSVGRRLKDNKSRIEEVLVRAKKAAQEAGFEVQEELEAKGRLTKITEADIAQIEEECLKAEEKEQKEQKEQIEELRVKSEEEKEQIEDERGKIEEEEKEEEEKEEKEEKEEEEEKKEEKERKEEKEEKTEQREKVEEKIQLEEELKAKEVTIQPLEIACHCEEKEYSGVILLEAIDYLKGTSLELLETIKKRLAQKERNLLSLIQSLIYLPLFKEEQNKVTVQRSEVNQGVIPAQA
ncbi:MAG: hypothetical protein QMD94_05505, partial [Candidatus Omnitrophota bacterium]|nr:hypothetical protein [Candidatus Omnitrophota bacterium]